MKRHAKASPAGSAEGTGNSRGLFRRAAVTRGAFGEVKGTGAPSNGRIGRTLTALALAIAACALLAAPASADTTEMISVTEVSYTTAQVKGEVETPPGFNNYEFQYSTDDGSTWSPGNFTFYLGGKNVVEEKLSVPKGGTKYLVRLVTAFGANAVSPTSLEFTTLAVDPPTIIATDDASGVFSTSATATGKVKRPTNNPDPAFNITACRFEYVTDAQFTATGFEGAAKSDCDQPLPFEAPEGETDVTAALTGLSPSTTYHLRLAAENAAPAPATKEATNSFTTLAPVAKPTVIATDDATDVTVHGAKFSGEVQRPAGADPALDVECRFEFVTDAQFTATGFEGAGSTPCAENPITAATANGEGKQVVHAEFGGFKPATTWHLRLTAENEGGVDTKDAVSTFTTLPADNPSLTIDPVASGTYTTAHVSGTITITAGHPATYIEFGISTDNVNWNYVTIPNINSGDGTYNIARDFTGLQPNTTYFFRIKSTYTGAGWDLAEANGEVAFTLEPNPSITTEEVFVPTAEDLEVTNVTGTSAHFSATVDPHAPGGTLSELGKKAFATHWEFVCTPECKNANGNPIEGTVQGEEGAQSVAGDAKRLEPNTHYEVTLVISSEGGGETVGPVPFDTPLVKPTVKAAPGGSDGKGGYTLQGVVNPNKSAVTDCEFKWGPNSSHYDFSAPCSPTPGAGSKLVTVEANLIGLTPDATYHALLVVTNGAGTEDGGDQTFVPTLNPAEPCPNEQLRAENSSLALPECRAYEMVTPPGKEGFLTRFLDYYREGNVERVVFTSRAPNLLNSGQAVTDNYYVAERSAAEWQMLADLNGPLGSIYGPPENITTATLGLTLAGPHYSADLLSSVWTFRRRGEAKGQLYLREPDGRFSLVGPATDGPDEKVNPSVIFGGSDDLSHIAMESQRNDFGVTWSGLGLYEYVGLGNSQPRRIDIDNAADPVSGCIYSNAINQHAILDSISSDGSRIFFTVAGCGGGNVPAREVWARVDGTTSFDVSASRCNRAAADPGGACNAPSDASFAASTPDGSRVFFTTVQQLLNGDTDQTNDLYVCDLPSGTPAPTGQSNLCDALTQVSAAAGANVERVLSTSEDGSTAVFTANGALADNADAFGEPAIPGDHNLYVWHQDAAHPAGTTTFVGRLSADDAVVQITPNGHYLVLSTKSALVPTDTDDARDVYRYDAETGQVARASTGISGTGGNGNGFDAEFSRPTEHHPTTAISDDGQKVVFATLEPLSPLDGNNSSDAYLWTPKRVSLITSGAVDGGGSEPVIAASGRDIYFNTPGAFSPSDGDKIADVYDARVGGGFSFARASCAGESCQADPSIPPVSQAPSSQRPGSGNPRQPKPCPKGKVRKRGKCVKKGGKRSHGNKSHEKKATHKRGGGK